VDRLIVTNRIGTRLTDSVEAALKEGNGAWRCTGGDSETGMTETLFSERLMPVRTATSAFDVLTPRHRFVQQSLRRLPATCAGLGTLLVFDED
jgi:excinuclease UvrABC ATPase subunit